MTDQENTNPFSKLPESDEPSKPNWRSKSSRLDKEASGPQPAPQQPPAAEPPAVDELPDDVIGEGTLVLNPGAQRTEFPNIPDVTLEKEIGRGGMGVVFSGRQGYLDRPVAVKVLNRDMASEEYTQRCAREAKILASLHHSNIVGCYQAGVSPDGDSYLVMEFIDGPTLGEWISENGPLPAKDAVEVCRLMAEALACAYRSGIIHRDVKPPNVLLRHVQGGEGEFPFEPMLADLGLARASGEMPTAFDMTLPELTVQGAVMGSPPTMAPEQFDDPDSVDFRTDIYGLGCVLYHALTGKLAFPQGSLTSLIARKAQETPPDPAKLRAEVPAGLSELVCDMLRPNRDDRPASYEELIERLSGPFKRGARPKLAKKKSKAPLFAGIAVLVVGAFALTQILGGDDPVSGDGQNGDSEEEDQDSDLEEGSETEKQLELERQRELERQQELERERELEKQRELERQRELEKERELAREKELEEQPAEPEGPRLPELASIAKGEVRNLLTGTLAESPIEGWSILIGGVGPWATAEDGNGADVMAFGREERLRAAVSLELPAPPWRLEGAFKIVQPMGMLEPVLAVVIVFGDAEGVRQGGVALQQLREGDDLRLRASKVTVNEVGGWDFTEELAELGIGTFTQDEYKNAPPAGFKVSWDAEHIHFEWTLLTGEQSWSQTFEQLAISGFPIEMGLQLENGIAQFRDLTITGQ